LTAAVATVLDGGACDYDAAACCQLPSGKAICLSPITSSHVVLQFVLQMARDRPAHLIQVRGGGRGYAQEMRDQVIFLWMNGEDLNAVWIELLRHQRKFPCLRTCRGGGSVSIKERVTLIAGGQLAIISPSARSTVKTSSILLLIELFDPRLTLTKSVHMCTIVTLQICCILVHRLVEPS